MGGPPLPPGIPKSAIVTTVGDPGEDTKVPSEQAVREALDVVPGSGDVSGPATNTDNNIPQWNGADSKELKDGLTLNTSVDDPGLDTELVTGKAVRDAIDTIGDKTVKATYFATIASGTTSGTITKPAGETATLVMDEWGTDTDALLSTMANGKPTFKSPVDASGDPITTTFDTGGNYSFSGTPSPAADHALIYVYTCKLSNFLSAEALWESELLADAVLATDYDAQSILAAVTKNNPTAIALSEQQLIGRLTGGNVAAVTIGIADNNIVQIDDADAADNDYAKFTANGLEGRSYAEVKTDLSLDSVENTAISTWAGSANITTIGTLSSGNADAAVTDAAADGATKGKAAFTATDFDAAAGVISLDFTNAQKASTTQPGFLTEVAIASEVNIGNDAARCISPDALAGSNFGIRYVTLTCIEYTTDVSTGDGKAYWSVPPGLNGMNLVSVHGENITAGTGTGTDVSTFQVYNETQAADMLSTALTIDEDETGSDTAATAAVIDTANDDISSYDVIRIDCDGVTPTTAPKGLIVTLGFQLP